MTIQLVDLGRQYRSIKDEIDTALLASVESTQYILGEEVQRFEEEFADYCGAGHCVGLASGTAALLLALEALDVGPGDEVIVPANTFIASLLPVLRLGATPVLVDCDELTATIDVERAEEAITPRTKALIGVHLYGQPFDFERLEALCTAHEIVLVEDACQAHGARYKSRRVGSLGRIAAFSFYPGKNLGAYGDAGAVTTDDDELAERIRLLRDLGQLRKYVHVLAGWNERLDTVQAAVLRVKLRHLEHWNSLRRSHAALYRRTLTGTNVMLPQTAAWAEHVWHLYVVRTAERDALRARLESQGIASGMHYPLPLHLQPGLAGLGYGLGDFPVTEAWANEVLSLPMFPELEPSEVVAIAEAVAAFSAAA
jgi:dTDP-4-amino-4,6-dideoxygalactose transaminase